MLTQLGNIIIADPSHKYENIFEQMIDYVYDNQKMCCIFWAGMETEALKPVSAPFSKKSI